MKKLTNIQQRQNVKQKITDKDGHKGRQKDKYKGRQKVSTKVETKLDTNVDKKSLVVRSREDF